VAPFEYEGQVFSAIRRPGVAPLTQGVLTPTGQRYRAATREQTLIDCLERPDLAGGSENVLRSVGGFRHIDSDILLGIADSRSSSLRARLGWVLEKRAEPWRVPDAVLGKLAESLGSGPHYFASSRTSRGEWVKR